MKQSRLLVDCGIAAQAWRSTIPLQSVEIVFSTYERLYWSERDRFHYFSRRIISIVQEKVESISITLYWIGLFDGRLNTYFIVLFLWFDEILYISQ